MGEALVSNKSCFSCYFINFQLCTFRRLQYGRIYNFVFCSPIPEGQSAGEDRILQLEGDLRDMRERLLNMSLEYAEVEAQRERLVMELKAVKKGGRWF